MNSVCAPMCVGQLALRLEPAARAMFWYRVRHYCASDHRTSQSSGSGGTTVVQGLLGALDQRATTSTRRAVLDLVCVKAKSDPENPIRNRIGFALQIRSGPAPRVEIYFFQT